MEKLSPKDAVGVLFSITLSQGDPISASAIAETYNALENLTQAELEYVVRAWASSDPDISPTILLNDANKFLRSENLFTLWGDVFTEIDDTDTTQANNEKARRE